MDDWGSDGSAIGPLKWCSRTYAAQIEIEFEKRSNAIEYFGVEEAHCHMNLECDMLTFGDMHCGDWTVYYVGPADCERPGDSFCEAPRSKTMYARVKVVL